MTKILESLSAFEGKSINQLQMGKIFGGVAAGNETAAGTRAIYDNCGSVLFNTSWTSDRNMGVGSNGVTIIDYCDLTATYP